MIPNEKLSASGHVTLGRGAGAFHIPAFREGVPVSTGLVLIKLAGPGPLCMAGHLNNIVKRL